MSGSVVNDRSRQVENKYEARWDFVKGNCDRFIKVKMSVIIEIKFGTLITNCLIQGGRPLNAVLLNTGSTVLVNQRVEKLDFGSCTKQN